MNAVVFSAACDVEINDIVTLLDITTTITDIRAVHYLKGQSVEFEFELSDLPGMWCKRSDFVYPAV